MSLAFLSLRSVRTGVVVFAGLLAAGIGLRVVEAPAWEVVRARQPSLRLESVKDALGQGVTVGLLGGFRAILADLFWIRTNYVWEQYDLPATQTSIKLVTAIDPRSLYFWLNGSQMIAYDMPNWRIDKAGGYDKVPDSVKRRFDLEQAKVAVDYLNEAFGFHPEHPLIRLAIGNIYLNRLKDTATAATYYKRAAEHPDAPFYAARIYAELLRKMNRNAEAYKYLCKLYPTLPKDNLQAMASTVLGRIRELEGELAIPAEKQFHE
jgi:tetratricopeptide (TPR) repeat protein